MSDPQGQSTGADTQSPKKKPSGGRFVAIAVVVVLVGGFSLPVSNLFISAPRGTAIAQAAEAHPEFAGTAALLEQNCMDCHSSQAKLPYYANLPIAKGMIQADMDKGTRYMDMLEELTPEAGEPYNEAALAKLEYVIREDTMPPTPYLAMHWNRGLRAREQETILQAIHKIREAHFATGTAREKYQHDALQPIPDSIAVDDRKVALGDQMYHDVRLSGDNTLSCASCHGIEKGGCDQVPVSTGIGGAKGPINSPTVFNAVFNVAQFWDGRATDLKDQASGPVHNPIEMGSNWEEVLEKLQNDEKVVAAFEAIYDDGLTGDNIADAIAEFEKSLITPNSRFDQYLKGNDDALTADERQGLALFRENACANCHVGKAMGGQSFEYMGRSEDYFAARGTEVAEADMGRYNVTKRERDRHMFKVPVLRNVALTYPYFHDAHAETLVDAVKLMAVHQGYRPYADAEAELVVQFLGSLTGEYAGEPLN